MSDRFARSVLLRRARRTRWRRFLHFFWRFLRATLVMGAAFGPAVPPPPPPPPQTVEVKADGDDDDDEP